MKKLILVLTLFLTVIGTIFAKTVLTTQLMDSAEPSYIKEGSVFSGVAIDIIGEINSRSSLVTIKHTNKLLPPARVINNLKERDIDIVMTLSRSPERELLIDYPDTELYDANITLYALATNKKAFQIKSVEDITGIVLGITGIRATTLAKSMGLKVQVANSLSQNVQKLKAKRGEYIVYNSLSVNAYLKSKGLENQIKECYILKPNKHFIALKKGTSREIISEINKIIIEMKFDGTIDKILAKWY